MPTYEYACTKCGHTFETFQSMKDAPLKKCPKCGKNTAKRQISGGGAFILKGSGWYADGYSSAGSGKPPASDSKCDGKCQTCDVKSEAPKAKSADTKASAA